MAMASSSLIFLLFTLFLASILSIKATSDLKLTKPIILSVKKGLTTHQYYTTINLGKPSYTFEAVIDVGGQLLWFNCEACNIMSSTYTPVECSTSECQDLEDGDGNYCVRCHDTPRLGCYQNGCLVTAYNSIKPSWFDGGAYRDNIAIGAQQYSKLVVPNFLFLCVPNFFLDGLAAGAQGLLGLGWTRYSMLSQISSTFNVPSRFAICAPSSNKPGRSGAIVFGGGPYHMTPYPNDVRDLLNWTYLSYDAERPSDYFIGVNSIKIDGKLVPFNYPSGKASISTTTPYTILRSDIYKAVVKEFLKSAETKNISRVAPIAPFSECFNGETIRHSRTGGDVPLIDLVLAPYRFNDAAVWRIYAANSMVRVKKHCVVCLGFLDGGVKAKTGIVIGGHQLEDNLVEFDLVDSRLGFSSSLLLHNSRCSHLKVA